MNTTEFNNEMTLLLADCQKILGGAAHEYSVETDRLENFNQLAKHGITPSQVCLVYLTKHIDGIKNYVCRDVTNQRDSIRGRIIDSINYLILLNAIIVEDGANLNKIDARNALDHLDNLYDERNRYAQRRGAIG